MTKARDTANLISTGVPNSLITLDAAEIPNISTDKLTSGTLPDARIAAMASSKLTGALPAISGASLTALPATLPASSGVNLTALNASNLGSGTIATARLGSGTADATTFLRGDGAYAAAGGGKVGQVITTQLTAPTSTTSTSMVAITGYNASITPVATSSKVLVTMYLTGGSHSNQHIHFQMFRDTTQIALGDADGSRVRATFGWRNEAHYSNYHANPFCVQWLDSPNTTSATSYSMKWSTTGNTVYLNRSWDNSDHANYHRTVSAITLQEITA